MDTILNLIFTQRFNISTRMNSGSFQIKSEQLGVFIRDFQFLFNYIFIICVIVYLHDIKNMVLYKMVIISAQADLFKAYQSKTVILQGINQKKNIEFKTIVYKH